MINLKVSEILKASRGSLVFGSKEKIIREISTDSRTIKKGDLFLPLSGENFNGEDFIQNALNKGACGYISTKLKAGSEKLKIGKNSLVIEVDDTLNALQDIARYVLKKVKPKVVAITGSNGKTTVKDMLKSILSLKYDVVASAANYNNEIGLSFTLLRLEPSTEIVVLEMAMRALGQIKELCSIAPPDMAIITNISQTHIELLGSVENIIKAKSEVVKGLKSNGKLFLNNDDQATKKISANADTVKFGSDSSADVSYKNISLDDLTRPSFTLTHKEGEVRIKLPVAGRHNVVNAVAAAAVAINLDVPLSKIKKGLEVAKLSFGRMQTSKANGWIIVNDSYNASPLSMEAAIKTLNEFKAQRKIAVLGDMLELGVFADVEHKKIGKIIARNNVDFLFTVGNLSKNIAISAIEAGFEKNRVKSYENCGQIKDEIVGNLQAGDAILIKASRAIKLDELAYYLQKKR